MKDATDELEQIVNVAEPTLRMLSAGTVTQRPAADRWTIQEVLGHLIDSAANNHQRFVRAQFVEKLVFPKYEQNEWVGSQQYAAADWNRLVDLWAAYNRHLAHVIRCVKPKALPTICVIGPYEPVTLQFLIEDYVVHLKHHLQKMAERAGVDPARLGCT
jgi:hypothetical protein